MVTIIATPGDPDANSYATMAEANQYFANRLPLAIPWIPDGDLEGQALLTAALYLDVMASPLSTFYPAQGSSAAYYMTRPTWTGQIATQTQYKSWPRLGMFDRNGRPIAEDVIPFDLKMAQCEFAGQLKAQDRTLDNDVIVQGIKSVRAGSVSVDFKDQIQARVWPDAVWNLLVPSWLTDEQIQYVASASFEVITPSSYR